MVDLSVVVVTYKTKDYVLNFLSSVCRELEGTNINTRLIVVDNASHDGTVEAVREEYPDAFIIENKENYGPAKAFNRGIEEGIDSKYLLVANSDIKVLPGTIKTMYQYLETHPDVMGVSGPLLNNDGSHQLTRTKVIALLPDRWDKPFQIEWVGNGFAMIRKEAFLRLGGYDENYYFYNEDLDWVERAKREGLCFMALPEAKVIHYSGKGRRHNRSRIMRELYWSNIYYFKKFYPKISWLVYRVQSVELSMKMSKLKRQLKRVDETQKKEIEQQIKDFAVAKKFMVEHYNNHLEPKIPFWE